MIFDGKIEIFAQDVSTDFTRQSRTFPNFNHKCKIYCILQLIDPQRGWRGPLMVWEQSISPPKKVLIFASKMCSNAHNITIFYTQYVIKHPFYHDFRTPDVVTIFLSLFSKSICGFHVTCVLAWLFALVRLAKVSLSSQLDFAQIMSFALLSRSQVSNHNCTHYSYESNRNLTYIFQRNSFINFQDIIERKSSPLVSF